MASYYCLLLCVLDTRVTMEYICDVVFVTAELNWYLSTIEKAARTLVVLDDDG